MVNYESDRTIQELQDEMYAREESKPGKNFWTRLTPQMRYFVAAIVGVLLFFTVTERISLQDALIFGAIGIIVLYFMKTGEYEQEELSWIECMVRIYELLYFLQKHPIGGYPQVPQGEVRVSPIGRKQWFEGRSFKRSYKVELYDEENDITEIYFVEIDVYNGDIITFKHAPEGVYGDETKDIKLMPTYDMLIGKKRDEYVSKGKKH